MGRLKQLLPVNNKPVILHCIDRIIASGIEDIIAVIRHDREDLKRALKRLPVRIALNRKAESEMAESVRAGLHAVDNSVTGIVVCLSDHPLITTDTFKILLKTHNDEGKKILIPCFKGKKGHPVLFPREVIHAVFSGMNLREVIHANLHRVKRVHVMDEGVLFDMDTMEDYKNILEKQKRESS
jgi:molybdenum cofactor cytidylyltransferase